MILVDTPRWPAHGTLYAHLVSDSSLWELHELARTIGLDPRAFDHDHYDLAARHHPAALAAGAQLVDSRELVRRLREAGLRITPAEHAPRRGRARQRTGALAVDLLGGHEDLVERLMARYSAPERRYHDLRHLDEMLRHQHSLADERHEQPSRAELLATLWHDAVHTGVAGDDEQASADLAGHELATAGLPRAEIAEVQRLILLTTTHQVDPDDLSGARLSDADMAILGSAPGRYHVSTRDLRIEYGRFDDTQWAAGRRAVLHGFLDAPSLFHSPEGRRRWQGRAEANITDELAHLSLPTGASQATG